MSEKGWVRIEEGMPEEGEKVLAYFENGDMAVLCYYNTVETGEQRWAATIGMGWECDCEDTPTHWMSLPEDPELESDS